MKWVETGKQVLQRVIHKVPEEQGGEQTGIDLGSNGYLFAPWQQNQWGQMAPPISQELLEGSLELAATAYHMRLDRWANAGWTDITMQVDNKLYADLKGNSFKAYLVQRELRQKDPVSQLVGTMRQREKSDALKAFVMCKWEESAYRYVVAIGFMGTGPRVDDWIPNMRFSKKDGMHLGFLQLARQFEQNFPEIQFDETAGMIGKESLSFRDILKECSRPHSRFLLWMAGHSQGGAVMQVITYIFMKEYGVLPENMLGVGYASPSVADGELVADASAYPLYHVLNMDDMVPRVGCMVHLGHLLEYTPDDDFRKKCYKSWDWTEEGCEKRELMLKLQKDMADTVSTLEGMYGCVLNLSRMQITDIWPALQAAGGVGPIMKAMGFSEEKARQLLNYIMRHVDKNYESLTGHKIPEDITEGWADRWALLNTEMKPAEIAGKMGRLCLEPHRLESKEQKEGAYATIVLEHSGELKNAQWVCGHHPFRVHSLNETCARRRNLTLRRQKRERLTRSKGKLPEERG